MTQRVLVKNPGEPAVEKEIEEGIKAKQEIVGGLIEGVPSYAIGLPDHIDLYFNEEGKICELDPNVNIGFDIICGPCFFVGYEPKTGSSLSLTDEDVATCKEWLKDRELTIVRFV